MLLQRTARGCYLRGVIGSGLMWQFIGWVWLQCVGFAEIMGGLIVIPLAVHRLGLRMGS